MNMLMGHNMMRKDGDAHMGERAGDVSRRVAAHGARYLGGRFRLMPTAFLRSWRRRVVPDLCKAFALPLSAECLKDITGLANMRFRIWMRGRRR